LTILHGASGVGKSSLVEGGLVPALRQKAIGTRDNVPVLIRQYNNWVGVILEALGESTGGIEAVLAKLRSNEGRNLRTVLIFDQFEEFFFVQADRVARQRFYSFLREAIELSNVKVILSLREDYLHYLLECRSEMSMINDGDVLSRKVLYEIGNFSRVDARSIIEDLTTRSQFTLEPALLDRLVADLAEPLGEVRPIELQIVGAQLQAENIRTLADYPVGGKAELVDRYLMGTIGDCGEGNGELAELVGYLLTDERGTRPLKTRDELVREMGDLKRSPLPEQLDLVLAVLVGSGLVMRLKESPDDRYQLVHDYLAGVIRDRQKPQFDRLAKELDEEKEKNRQLEQDVNELKNIREKEQKTIQDLSILRERLEKDISSREKYEAIWSEEYETQYRNLENKYWEMTMTVRKSQRDVGVILEKFHPVKYHEYDPVRHDYYVIYERDKELILTNLKEVDRLLRESIHNLVTHSRGNLRDIKTSERHILRDKRNESGTIYQDRRISNATSIALLIFSMTYSVLSLLIFLIKLVYPIFPLRNEGLITCNS
jgi:hypothetical protein